MTQLVDSLVDVVNYIKDFISNIVSVITDFINFLPNDIKLIFIPILSFVIAIYIYRFIR